MIIVEELQQLLDQYNAHNVMIIDVKDKSYISDHLIIATVGSRVQMASILSHISSFLRNRDIKILFTEGIEDGNWGIIDIGNVIIHLFRNEVRQYYKIEDIWLKSPKKILDNSI